MPAVRFARDKRGYEYVYLVHTPVRRGRPGRQRVLYWYRTPPGVSVGRKPFDEEVRRSLEREYPGVRFDWDAIVSTPMPPPDMTEYWRERRKAERAAKLERRAAEAAEAAEGEGDQLPAPAERGETPAGETARPGATGEMTTAAPTGPADADQQESRKRRRRRGGRRRSGAAPGSPAGQGDQVVAADAPPPGPQSGNVDPPSEER